jgi:hypothetical protein
MFAGGIAGMTVEATLFPLDTLKTRLQTRVKGQPISFKGMYRGVPGTTYPIISMPLPTACAAVFLQLREQLVYVREIRAAFGDAYYLRLGSGAGDILLSFAYSHDTLPFRHMHGLRFVAAMDLEGTKHPFDSSVKPASPQLSSAVREALVVGCIEGQWVTPRNGEG